MSFLYRAALTITRKQPYIDWANSQGDGGPELTAELANDRRTIYLVPESSQEPDLALLIEEFWEQIFEEELAAWMLDEETWPTPISREMFAAWFASEVTSSVFDLTPEEPLTQADVEDADLAYTAGHCAWCDIVIGDDSGRFVGFPLEDRSRFASREGLVISFALDRNRSVVGIMSVADSPAARAGDDVSFRACTSRCEKALRKAVPKALRKARGTS
jgi:hypothetical protein